MEQVPQLTDRQREVVNLLRQGQSNKQIALSLGISERTVRRLLERFDELATEEAPT